MPALQIPKGKTLYDILEIDKETANETIIKKAYRKLALKYHPDKQASTATQQEKENATYEFQLIGLAYTILSDTAKKNNYDRTGSLEEETWLSEDKDWNDYFKALWTGIVNEKTINEHLSTYKGSKEETDDVLKYYTTVEGNMDKLLNYVMHSDCMDVPRFTKIIQEAIKNKQVKHYPQFDKTTTASAHARRIKKAAKEEGIVKNDRSLQNLITVKSNEVQHLSKFKLGSSMEELAKAFDRKYGKKKLAASNGAQFLDNIKPNATEEELAEAFDKKYGKKKSPKKKSTTQQKDSSDDIKKRNITVPKSDASKKPVNNNKRKLEKLPEVKDVQQDSLSKRPKKSSKKTE